MYTFAYRIIVQPTSAFVGAIGAYLFPKISMIQDDPAEIRSSYLFVSKATNTVITPLLIMVMILSPMIIAPVFGGEVGAGRAFNPDIGGLRHNNPLDIARGTGDEGVEPSRLAP